MKKRDNLVKDLRETLKNDKRAFLTGCGGAGKTYTINKMQEAQPTEKSKKTVTKKIIDNDFPVFDTGEESRFLNSWDTKRLTSINLSTTGISAILINGQTIHSFFRLGYSKNIRQLRSNDEAFLKRTGLTQAGLLRKFADAVRSADFIQIDEVSMMSSDIYEMIMYRLAQIKEYEVPILMSGDFLQLQPVDGIPIYHTEKFNEFPIFNLNKVYRTTDSDFLEFLNKVRMGEIDSKVLEYIISKHPSKMQFDESKVLNLYSTNNLVNTVNSIRMQENKNKPFSFKAELIPCEITPNANVYQTFLSNAKISETLVLKKDCRVMNTRNNGENGLVNGDVGTVIGFLDNAVQVDFDRFDSPIWVEYDLFEQIEYKMVSGSLTPVKMFTVSALPLTIAFAMTIHKSQGSTLSGAYIHATDIFAESQLYVALSRLSDPNNMQVYFDYTTNGLKTLENNLKHINKSAKMWYNSLNESCQYE